MLKQRRNAVYYKRAGVMGSPALPPPMFHPTSLIPFLLCAPLLVSAGQYRSIGRPLPDGTSPPGAIGIQHNTRANTTDASSGIIASAWYPAWLAGTYPPSSIPWDRYNAMTFAFAITTPDPEHPIGWPKDNSSNVLPVFVSAAQAAGVPALLSIGGWSGSVYYSTAVGSPANRTSFVNAILGFVLKYNLSGIDFDWEYPGSSAGLACNVVNPAADSDNFLAMLQELRNTTQGKNLILTAAVGTNPFSGKDGEPMKDVSAFAEVLDRIAIMAYDVWGNWPGSTIVGPNAPLDDNCAPPADQKGSAVRAVQAWTSAGFPANKTTLGLASYGHSFKVPPSAALIDSGNGSTVALYPTFDNSPGAQPVGSSDDPTDQTPDPCGKLPVISGEFTFAGLISEGYLTANGTAADGIDYVFDSCSQTPFVYNKTSQVMISYDDADSFAAKGKFIMSQNLAGFAVWDVTGDSNDTILLDALHTAMGLELDQCE
ncbi:glycoside hydrolase family 18 protein [Mycena filopes]|nr:glycoside hydrolase family 18 protein [Mycena filopes]